SVRDLPGLRVQSGGTSPGLRSLPEFLSAWAGEDPDGFELSAQLARASGQLWLQLSALAWLAALRPRPRDLRPLCLFLEASGWRRITSRTATERPDCRSARWRSWISPDAVSRIVRSESGSLSAGIRSRDTSPTRARSSALRTARKPPCASRRCAAASAAASYT